MPFSYICVCVLTEFLVLFIEDQNAAKFEIQECFEFLVICVIDLAYKVSDGNYELDWFDLWSCALIKLSFMHVLGDDLKDRLKFGKQSLKLG